MYIQVKLLAHTVKYNVNSQMNVFILNIWLHPADPGIKVEEHHFIKINVKTPGMS